jgi:hypothetical protein
MISYKFKLRDDLPQGFMNNENYPELPATVKFLYQFEGKTFFTAQQFQEQVLDRFLEYLNSNSVPEGKDSLLRTGLVLEKNKERYEGPSGIFDYFVFTEADNLPGRCVFGGLEQLTL